MTQRLQLTLPSISYSHSRKPLTSSWMIISMLLQLEKWRAFPERKGNCSCCHFLLPENWIKQAWFFFFFSGMSQKASIAYPWSSLHAVEVSSMVPASQNKIGVVVEFLTLLGCCLGEAWGSLLGRLPVLPAADLLPKWSAVLLTACSIF